MSAATIVPARLGVRARAAAVLLLACSALGCPSATPTYVPKDASLRALPLYFYPASGAPRAVIVFFGNDVGFWKAHDELARRFAAHGYDVIGVDVKQYINGLPEDHAPRERAFQSSIDDVIARSVRELRAEGLPLVIGGHSFGADLALWTAVHAPPARMVGVLALGPTERSHFYVTAYDRANLGEPNEAGSFSVADQVHNVPSGVRIALLRGSHDRRIVFDSLFQVAGGGRLRYTRIPFASHSLQSLTIAGPMAEGAVDWILDGK
ncbi:MAG: hypothetical protein M3R65_05905 [Gemmatimonadota bacterium]|nr:hypothetical protein [Gemmatimonadota bacterium]